MTMNDIYIVERIIYLFIHQHYFYWNIGFSSDYTYPLLPDTELCESEGICVIWETTDKCPKERRWKFVSQLRFTNIFVAELLNLFGHFWQQLNLIKDSRIYATPNRIHIRIINPLTIVPIEVSCNRFYYIKKIELKK